MSRRCHHGSPRHARLPGRERRRPTISERATTIERPATERGVPSDAPTMPAAARPAPTLPERPAARELREAIPPGLAPAQQSAPEPSPITAASAEERPRRVAPAAPQHRPAARSVNTAAPSAPGDEGSIERGATAPQLRRFIKSRAYVPMHELRRRFAINGGDDEVTAVDIDRQRVFVGLPEREGRLLGELLRSGDIGYELSLDPISPIVVGVYPMRPVTRA